MRGELRSFCLDACQQSMLREYESTKELRHVILCARRLGKCLAAGTLITTTNRGVVPIEDIKIGDFVWGYNEDSSITPVEVKQVHDQGEKEIVDLTHQGRVIASCTLDHQWLVYDVRTGKYQVKAVKDFTSRDKLVRSHPIGGDGKHIADAYVLGALLGDGCSKQNVTGNVVYISSIDERIPRKIARILECEYFKICGKNYTWAIRKGDQGDTKFKRAEGPLSISFYNEWVKDRYAHEKICDLQEIKTWDRVSKLNLLAGILDTDGAVYVNDASLVLSVSMMAPTVIQTVKYLFLELWGIELGYLIDKRDKYKGGDCHVVFIKHNALIREALKELDALLETPNKKWKEEYALLTYQKHAEFTGVKIGNKRVAQTYDLGVANDTHLYLTANGHVTHNSWMLVTLALEAAIQNKRHLIKYITDTYKSTKEVVIPLFATILSSCPAGLRPEFKKNDGKYVFPNGSEILLHGVDNGGGNSLRGQSADLAIIDEAAFISSEHLDNLITSILAPMVIERDGRMLLSSTPPEDMQHTFLFYVAEAERKKALTKRIITDCPRYTEKKIQEFLESTGGVDHERTRREFFCECIRSDDFSIVPEFNEVAEKEIVYSKPFDLSFDPDTYVSLDPGFADNTALLFGYWDFPNATLDIQREFVASGQTTQELASTIKKIERDLWGGVEPYRRLSDTDLRLIQDLRTAHNLKFRKTDKDMKEAQINALRILVKNRQIRIHESCVNLRQQLRYGQFKTTASGRRDFKRSAQLGHCDAIDALLYLIRNINKTRNPIAEPYFDPTVYFDPYGAQKPSNNINKLKSLFN